MGYLASEQYLVLAMGFADGGTLKSHLAQERVAPLDWYSEILPIMLGVSRGMQYVHCSSILHRDLKNENVLLKSLGKGKGMKPWIADFGESAEKLDYTMTS